VGCSADGKRGQIVVSDRLIYVYQSFDLIALIDPESWTAISNRNELFLLNDCMLQQLSLR